MMFNNKRFWIRTVLYLISCFICSSFIISHAYCSEDNPYCTNDQERIQQLTDEFIQTYGDEVEIRWNEDTGIPSRVRNIYPNPSDIDLDNPKGSAISFLSENSSFLGLDMDDLKYSDKNDMTHGYRIDFDVIYQGVQVEDSTVCVFIYDREDGISLYIKSNYLACIDLDVDPTVSSTEAANIVKKDLGVSKLVYATRTSAYNSSYNTTGGSYYPSGPIGFYANVFNSYPSPYPYPGTYYSPTIPSPYSYSSRYTEEKAEPDLIVYDKDGEVYLTWKFLCSKEASGGYRHYYYYIDAHSGDIIHDFELVPYSSGPVNNTSSTNNLYNPYTIYNPTYTTPYNTPYNTPYSNPYTPYNTPYTPYNTPYTPYNTPYTPYNTPYTPYNTPYTPYTSIYNNPFNTPFDIPYTPYSSSNGIYNTFWGGSNYFPWGTAFPYMSNPYYGAPY